MGIRAARLHSKVGFLGNAMSGPKRRRSLSRSRSRESAPFDSCKPLEENEELLRQMAESIFEIFWMLDADSMRVTYVSPAYEAITGRTCASLYENPLSYREVIHPEDRMRVLAPLNELLASNTFDEEFRIVRSDGKVRWIWSRGFLVRDSRGRIYRIAGTALDITPRKNAEIALRESEERYRDLVEHSEDLICTHDLSGRLISVNELPARLLGYSPSELLKIPMRELVAPEFRSQFDDYLTFIGKHGVAAGILCVLTKAGDRKLWEYHNTLQREGARPGFVRGIAHDVTEQRRMERALKLSEEKFSKAFKSNPAAITISTLESGRIIDVNASFEEMSGFPRDELIAKTSLDVGILDPSEWEKIVEILRARGSILGAEVKIRHKSGKMITARFSCDVIELGGEKCVLTLGEDITQRKEAESQLLEKTAYLDALIQESPVAKLVYDHEGRITLCNHAFERLFQYRLEEISGKNLDQIMAPPELVAEAEKYTALTLHRQAVHASGQRRRKDGKLIDVEIHGVPFKTEGRLLGGYVVYIDLSGRRRLQEQLFRTQQLEAIAHVAAGIAHDFNNTLTGILGFAQLLSKSMSPGSVQHNRAEQIVAAAIRGRVITSQLLSMGAPGRGEQKVLDLARLVRDSESILRTILGENIKLSIQIRPNRGLALVDPDQFLQVLMNLTLNARDSMPTGGEFIIDISDRNPPVEAASPDIALKDGGYVVASFTDTGIGMDEATKSRIFEPFFTTKLYGKGTGLGLTSVAGIVERTGGFIEVESAPGRGSSFRIFLPQAKGAMTPVQEPGKSSGVELSPQVHTILLAEDDDAVRHVAEAVFEEHRLRVLSARTGLDAISLAEQHAGPIDLLITDVVMPELSGPDLAKCLKKRRSELKVLFVTGYDAEKLAAHINSSPAYPTLRKPFRQEELIEMINKAIDFAADRPT